MSARRAALVGAALGLAAAVAAPAGAAPPLPASPAPGVTAPKPVAGKAPEVEEQVDDELLEFLGSVGEDADDQGGWLDFLASNDVDQVAKARGKAPARGK